MKKTKPKPKPRQIIPLPIHFKKPGRSYSQIGRKGNVALYAVYSDYFCLPGFALPYLLIGFELVCAKIHNGAERYPWPCEFGKCAWSIPKASREFAELALESAESDGRNFSAQYFKPFLTGRSVPQNARLWRSFKGEDGLIARKLPQSRHKVSVTLEKS